MFLSENIFKTLLKLQYISLDQQFAGTLFLWEPYNVLKTISDCEQKILNSAEYYPPRNSKLLSLSHEKLSDRKALFWIFSIFFRLRPKLDSSIENLGIVFKSVFFLFSKHFGEKSFCWKAYTFVRFSNWSRKIIDCSRSFVVKSVKTALSVSWWHFRYKQFSLNNLQGYE